MNKRQKEIAQYQLDAEKVVLDRLKRQYKTALNDINRKIDILQADELTQSRIYRIEHQKALKAQVEAILEKLHSDEYGTIQEFLTASYTDAFVGVAYDLAGQGIPLIMPIDPAEAVRAIQTDSKIKESLYEALGVDTKKLKTSISSEITRGIAGGMSTNEIARNISNSTKAPLSRSMTIVRTESHRIQQASCYNAQKTAISKGADVVKMWDSTMDGDTRPTHRHLDGQIREVDEPFKMDGKSAMYPGDFGDPAEDCNCRCQSLQRAKWALDEKELQTLKNRAEFFGLDKTKDYEEFKEKYLNSVKTIEKFEKNGKIDIGFQFFAHMSKDKFVAYALNPEKAPDKAKAFKEALGYDLSNYTDLMLNIESKIDESKFVPKDDIGYGMRYEYVIELDGPNGKKANVLTAWIQDGDEKRMTSVYVTDKKVTE